MAISEIGNYVRNAIRKDFEKQFNNNSKITALYKAIKSRTATEQQSYEFAKEVSKITNGLFDTYLNNDSYLQKEAYEELVNDVITPILEKDYGVISSYISNVQKIKYEELKLGLNPVEPSLDVNRTQGLIKVASEAENYSEIQESFSQKVENFNYHIVDEAIKQNAEFMSGSGFTTKITRTTQGKTCEWCRNLAGTYYDPSSGDGEIFARHDNCDCQIKVEYSKNKKPSYYMRTSGNAFVRSS